MMFYKNNWLQKLWIDDQRLNDNQVDAIKLLESIESNLYVY